MPITEQKTFQRQVAYKIKVSDILNGSFIKDDVSAGYIKLNGMSISRVNIMATVVYKPEGHDFNNAVIDDGSGRIPLRIFDTVNIFSKVEIGDSVLMVGKIREFNNEKYVLPEILKKIDNFEWMNVRKLELDSKDANGSTEAAADNSARSPGTEIYDKIYSLIKEMDNGDGVCVDDLIKKSNNSKAEAVISKLLENGDIFEITPGKLKVLE